MTYTLLGSSLQVNLIGANAKTTNSNQFLGFIKDLLCKLGFGTNTNDMSVSNLFNQFITNKSLGIRLNLLSICEVSH
jgi:hypothetical protein